MLLEFSVANFRSFNEKQTLSLIASRDRHNAENIYGEKPRVLKSIAVFGANASGKSNLVRAVEFMEHLVLTSATRMTEGDTIDEAVPFRLLSSMVSLPTSLEICLIVQGIHYRYGFSANNERVTEEWLFVQKPRSKERKWLERVYNVEKSLYQYKCEADLNKHEDLLSERTRSNSLALSVGVQQNIDALKPLYGWFRSSLWCFDFTAGLDTLVKSTAKECLNSPEARSRVSRMMQDADIRISGLKVQELPAVSPSLPDNAPPELKKLFLALEELNDRQGLNGVRPKPIQIQTQHLTVDTKEPVWFDISDESNGTQRFFAVAGVLLEALDRGQVVFIDEFECNMHPRLAQRLIAWFQHSDINKTGAQLVVTTHDSTLMHPNLLRRDQIWLAEKDANSATILYSLNDLDDDKKGRSTEIFQRHYLAGEYGGVPLFGRTFEEPRMP